MLSVPDVRCTAVPAPRGRKSNSCAAILAIGLTSDKDRGSIYVARTGVLQSDTLDSEVAVDDDNLSGGVFLLVSWFRSSRIAFCDRCSPDVWVLDPRRKAMRSSQKPL